VKRIETVRLARVVATVFKTQRGDEPKDMTIQRRFAEQINLTKYILLMSFEADRQSLPGETFGCAKKANRRFAGRLYLDT
jgi:hypothetical protein